MNKKILLVIGSFILLIFIGVGGIIAAIVGTLYYASKNTEEFQCAMSITKKNEKAIDVLGDSIEDSFWVLPRITLEGSKREVYISATIEGSKSSGTIYISSYRDSFRNDFSVSIEADGRKIPIHKGTFPCIDENK